MLKKGIIIFIILGLPFSYGFLDNLFSGSLADLSGKAVATGTYTRIGYENNYLSIDCGNNKKVQIKTMRYGKMGLNNQCPKVNEECNNEQSCSVRITNDNCGGDPIYGISKDWTVTYDCVDTGTTPSQPSTPTPTPQTFTCGSSHLVPTTTVGTVKGPNTYTSGYSQTSWKYSTDATTSTPCKWKCDTGYHYKSFGLNNYGCEADSTTSLCGFGTGHGTGVGVIKGSDRYTSGYTPTTWTYSEDATTSTPCMWKCDTGYHKVGNSCVVDTTQPSTGGDGGSGGSQGPTVAQIQGCLDRTTKAEKIECILNLIV